MFMYYYCFFLTKMGGRVVVVMCNALGSSALKHENLSLGQLNL
jgi:hypothetical protein